MILLRSAAAGLPSPLGLRRDKTARPAFVNLRRGRQEASKTAPTVRDPDVIAAEIVEDLEAALAQLKLARCPHSLTASLAALPSGSLIPFTPFAEIANDLKTN